MGDWEIGKLVNRQEGQRWNTLGCLLSLHAPHIPAFLVGVREHIEYICNGPQKLDSFWVILRGYLAPSEPAAKRLQTRLVLGIPRQNGCACSCTRLR